MSGFFPFGGQSGAPGSGLPAGTATGQLLVWNGSAWVPSVVGSHVFEPGAQTVNNGVGPFFLFGVYIVGTTGGLANSVSSRNPFSGAHLRRFGIEHTTPVAGNVITYTVWENGVPTALTLAQDSSVGGVLWSDTDLAIADNAQIAVQASNLGAAPLATRTRAYLIIEGFVP